MIEVVMFQKSNLLSLSMATQYIVNDKGEKTAVQQKLELTDEYKKMIDTMLATENTAKYVSYGTIKERFGIYSNRSDQ
ncbi:hypothetical protein HQ865_14030 [Mucilaginibacter mali]|uniref:Uncharacterized protein n=1 Tax=Mucilaginibacter mali TaxID=2740462 RepID=A0A7D4UDP2_9SPHI|nr:hypothetical protein [Mucilaginibacter mali]QKJ30819.1 hypothetical protein HQ865_14030 [Mucilaginibacter mali]